MSTRQEREKLLIVSPDDTAQEAAKRAEAS